MRDNDGRKLSKAAREQLRITAVKRVLAGESPEEVIRSTGFNRRCIYQWLAAYRSGGFEALKDNKNHGGCPPSSILMVIWVTFFMRHHGLLTLFFASGILARVALKDGGLY
jgi:hypothetical protein